MKELEPEGMDQFSKGIIVGVLLCIPFWLIVLVAFFAWIYD